MPSKSFRVYFPAGLDLERHGFVKATNDYDYGYIVLNAIVKWNSYQVKNRQRVPLPADYLRKITSNKDYKTVLDKLLNHNVIEVLDDGSYKTGVNKKGVCRRYKLASKWDIKLYDYHDITSLKLVENYYRSRSNSRAMASLVWHSITRLIEDISRFTVTELPTPLCIPMDVLANGQTWCEVDPAGHRLHTVLTSLPREYRKLIRLDGERVWCVDVVSSQPVIIHLLTRSEGNVTPPSNVDHVLTDVKCHTPRAVTNNNTSTKDKCHTPNISYRGNKETQPTPPQPHQPPPSYPVEMSHPQSVKKQPFFENNSDICQSDRKRELELESGDFYDQVADRSGVTRDEAKDYFMVFMFGNDRSKSERAVRAGNVMTGAYPVFARRARELKAAAGGGSGFACLLQRTEAKAILGHAIAQLHAERPESAFASLHDAILCREQDVPAVERAIKTAFLTTLGHEVKVKSELW